MEKAWLIVIILLWCVYLKKCLFAKGSESARESVRLLAVAPEKCDVGNKDSFETF